MNNTNYQSSLNNTISVTKVEFVVKKFPTKKISGLDDFTGELLQTFKEKVMQILQTLPESLRKGNTFQLIL